MSKLAEFADIHWQAILLHILRVLCEGSKIRCVKAQNVCFSAEFLRKHSFFLYILLTDGADCWCNWNSTLLVGWQTSHVQINEQAPKHGNILFADIEIREAFWLLRHLRCLRTHKYVYIVRDAHLCPFGLCGCDMRMAGSNYRISRDAIIGTGDISQLDIIEVCVCACFGYR